MMYHVIDGTLHKAYKPWHNGRLNFKQGDKMGEKKGLVVKSNTLINSSIRMNLVEQQLILFAIVKARETQTGLSDASYVDIPAADFAAKFGTNVDNVYRDLKSAVDTLFDRRFLIHDTNPITGEPRVIHSRWVSAVAYTPASGMVQLRFAPECAVHVTRQESDFTSYRLEQVSAMSSVHAVHLYELLAQYKGIGKRSLGIAELKTLLQIEGEYPRLDRFKADVIDVGVDQINKHSDLQVSYTQRKNGRSITHLVFAIKVKADALPKKIKVDEAYVKAHALPGERNFDAWQRCRAEVKVENNPPKKILPKPTPPPVQPTPPAPETPESREAARVARANINATLAVMKLRNNRDG